MTLTSLKTLLLGVGAAFALAACDSPKFSVVEEALREELARNYMRTGAFFANSKAIRSVECGIPASERVNCAVIFQQSLGSKKIDVVVESPQSTNQGEGAALFPSQFVLTQGWHMESYPRERGYYVLDVYTDLRPEVVSLDAAAKRMAYVVDQAVQEAFKVGGTALAQEMTAFRNAESYK